MGLSAEEFLARFDTGGVTPTEYVTFFGLDEPPTQICPRCNRTGKIGWSTPMKQSETRVSTFAVDNVSKSFCSLCLLQALEKLVPTMLELPKEEPSKKG